MDEDYLRTCARHVGLNPLRAGLAARAIDWRWSSARAPGRPGSFRGAPGPLGAAMAGFFELDVKEDARRKLEVGTDTTFCPT